MNEAMQTGFQEVYLVKADVGELGSRLDSLGQELRALAAVSGASAAAAAPSADSSAPSGMVPCVVADFVWLGQLV